MKRNFSLLLVGLLMSLVALLAMPDTSHADDLCVGNVPDGVWQPDLHEQCDSGENEAACQGCVIQEGYMCAPSIHFDALTVETYPFRTGKPIDESNGGSWTLGTFTGTQTVNSWNPTLAYMGADSMAMDYQISMSVDDNDDDFIGFVLGFTPGDTTNSNARYLLVDWKGAVDPQRVLAPADNTSYNTTTGIKLALVEGVPVASMVTSQVADTVKGNEFWIIGSEANPQDKTDHISILQWADGGYGKNGTGWKKPDTNKSDTWLFDIHYRSDKLVIQLKNKTTNGPWVTIFDVTPDDLDGYNYTDFPSGQLAFYGLSQSNTTYTLEGDHTSSCREIDLDPQPDTRSVDGATSVTFSATGITANDGLDADPGRVTVRTSGADGPQYGTVVDNGDGTYTYTPNSGSSSNPFNDQDVFTYEVCGKVNASYNWNPADECKETTITITKTVTPPAIDDDSISIVKGKSKTYFVKTDATAHEGSYSIDFSQTTVTVPASVTDDGVTVNTVNDAITIAVPADYDGPTSFELTYTVKDSRGNASVPPTKLTVNVVFPPSLSDNAVFETYAGCDLITGCVDSYDVSDATAAGHTHPLDPSTLTIVSDASPSEVTVTVDNGNIKVTAPADYAGTGPFAVTYTIQDTDGNTSNVGTLQVTVQPQQDVHITQLDGKAPTSGMYTTSNKPPFIGDSHPNTTIGISLDGPVSLSDAATTDNSGDWSWTPSALTPGTYTMTVTGANGSTDVLAFEVVAPFTPTEDTMQGAQGATGTKPIAELLANDGNADAAKFELIVGSENGGTVVVDGNNVAFTTNDDAEVASFEYKICAAYDSTICENVLVTVNVAQKPNGTASEYWSIVDKERTVPSPYATNVNTDVTNITNGAVAVIESDDRITVTPAAGYVGPVVVSVEGCTKTTPAACSTTDITVIFNDLPIVTNDGASKLVSPGGTQSTGIDVDPLMVGDISWSTLVLEGNANTGGGTCAVSSTNKRVSFTASNTAADGSTHTCTISICERYPTLTADGVQACTSASYTFEVTSSFFAEDDDLYTHENTPVDFTADDLLQNDNGYDPNSFEINNPGADPDTWTTEHGGSITVDQDGTYTYTPPADVDGEAFVGDDTFSYKVCPAVNDGTPCADDVVVTVHVERAPKAEGTIVWVKTGTPSVDVALDALFNAESGIGAVTTPATVTDASGTHSASANGCLAGDADCGDPVDGDAFVHIVPDDPNAPARYDIQTTICDDAPTPACADDVTITVIYNEPPIVNAPSTIITPNGKKTVNLDGANDPIASPGEQGTIDWSTLTILDGDDNPTSDPVNDGEISCTIEGRNIVFRASENAQVGDTGSCTIQLCEEQPADTCTTAVFDFEVQNVFDPSDDALTTIEDTPLNIEIWEDLVRNDGNADYPDSFILIPDGETSLTTTEGGTVTLDPNEAGNVVYTPASGFHGVDTFTYTICSSIDATDCEDVTVTVTVLAHVRITPPDTKEPVDTITGTAEPGSKVTLTIGDTTYGPVDVDEDGHWTITLDEPLAVGEHTITATTDYNDEDTLTFTVSDKDDTTTPDDDDDNDDDDDKNNDNDDDDDDDDDTNTDTPSTDIVVSGGRIGSCASMGNSPGSGAGLIALLAGLALMRRRR